MQAELNNKIDSCLKDVQKLNILEYDDIVEQIKLTRELIKNKKELKPVLFKKKEYEIELSKLYFRLDYLLEELRLNELDQHISKLITSNKIEN